MSGPRVLVVADDLIWSTRLAALVEGAGGQTVRVRSSAALEASLAGADRALVDLTARAYDPVAVVERLTAAGLPVLAVGQHDDLVARRQVIAAGAERVYAYRKLHTDGPATIGAWLGEGAGVTRTT